MEAIEVIEMKNRLAVSVERKSFRCMRINIRRDSAFLKNAFLSAAAIIPRLNMGQANTSLVRDLSTVEIDNLSGMIAELACEEVLKWYYGKDKIRKPNSNTSYNQIDLMLHNQKTIEVRSSCVRNGIEFALFAKNRVKQEEQYFDVIGPYSNEYKPGEADKDYYMRVLYVCDKMKFMDLFQKPELHLYITGGATGQMMRNPAYYQVKHLVPAGGQVQVESDYRVIPLARSLDIVDFFTVLERENNMRQVVR